VIGTGQILLADNTALVITLLWVVPMLLAWFWYRAVRHKRLIEDVPTSKVKGVAIGLTEVKGQALRDEPFVSYLAHAPTVWYSYNVAEHWRRTVREHYTDSKGNRKSRTRTETGWTTVQQDLVAGLFFLEDDTGAVRVDPTSATVQGRQVFSHTCSSSDPLYYGKGPPGSVANSTGTRSFTEQAIVIGDPLYVMGSARLREDAVAAEIAYDPDDPMFLITTKDESQVASGYGLRATLFGFFGMLASAACGGAYLATSRSMGPGDTVVQQSAALGALGYLVLLSLLYAMLMYNGLVRVRERIGKAWALIEVQLQRRADLVPQLAAVVKGYADHEREVQAGLAALRSSSLTGRARTPGNALVADAEQVADGQTALLNRVLAVVEAYPQLKANGHYLHLQGQLADTEDRIALARSFYNETVTAYNVRIATLPDLLFARLMGLGRVCHYEIQAFERRPVQVDLSPAEGARPPDSPAMV